MRRKAQRRRDTHRVLVDDGKGARRGRDPPREEIQLGFYIPGSTVIRPTSYVRLRNRKRSLDASGKAAKTIG